MVCGYLRACYTTQARLIKDRPDIVSPIRWYWCAEDAQPLPVPHLVDPLSWMPAEDAAARELGELPGAARPFYHGNLAGRPPGEHYHGDPLHFAEGCPEGENLPRNGTTGLPAECNVIVPEGGALLGGSMVPVPHPPGVVTKCCPAGQLRQVLRVSLTNPTGDLIGFPSLVTVTHGYDLPRNADVWRADLPNAEHSLPSSMQAASVAFYCERTQRPPPGNFLVMEIRISMTNGDQLQGLGDFPVQHACSAPFYQAVSSFYRGTPIANYRGKLDVSLGDV